MQTNTGPTEFFEQPWYNLGLWIHNKIVFDRLLVSGVAIGTDIGVCYGISYPYTKKYILPYLYSSLAYCST